MRSLAFLAATLAIMALAFSAILIAVQWADLQGSEASNAMGDESQAR